MINNYVLNGCLHLTSSVLPVSVNSGTIVRWGRKINSKALNIYKKHSGQELYDILNTLPSPSVASFITSATSHPLHLSLTFYGSFITKKGTIRIKDASNMIKSCEDLLFETLKTYSIKNDLNVLNDAQVFLLTVEKIDCSEEKVVIKLECYNKSIEKRCNEN